MNYEQHVGHLDAEAHSFADAVAACDLDVMVLPCPDWSVRDLARHVGGLYHWSSTIVEQRIVTETWPHQLPAAAPDDGDWAAWIRTRLEAALTVFRAADPSARVWTWGNDPHARTWPRRMLYETLIHRLDLATTNGRPLEVSSEIAAEGVDEWLENLRAVVQVPVATIATDQRTLSLAADDTGDAWRVLLTPHGWRWDRDASHGDVHVTGSAKELLLMLQGRGPGATRAEGDQVLLEAWLDAASWASVAAAAIPSQLAREALEEGYLAV